MYGGTTLTERERTILELLATPLTRSGIARELYLSVNTVKTHVARVYTKLAVTTRDEAIVKARAEGLLSASADGAQAGRLFEAIVRNISVLITVVDAGGHLVWANPSFRSMLGEPADAHLGRPFAELAHPDDHDRLRDAFAESAAEPGSSVGFECRLARADGTWQPVRGHQINRLHDAAVRGFVGTATAQSSGYELRTR